MGQQPDAADLVSVILPTFNRGRTLTRAINSVLHQGYANLELLVVDDASTDDTAEVMAKITDPRVRYVRLAKNGGASRARNEGLRIAKGDYIAFQDSDDEWLADKLHRQLAVAKAAGGPDDAICVFHTKVMYVSGETSQTRRNKIVCIPELDRNPDRDYLIAEVHKGNLISPQALLMSRGAVAAVGLFDQKLVNCVDWDYAIKLIYRTQAIFIDEPLVMTYLQTDSISILGRRGVRSQLRIALKLLREHDVDRKVMAGHFSRIGWWISKLGNPRMGRRILRRSIGLAPGAWKTWARLAAAEGLVLRAILDPRARIRQPTRRKAVGVATA
ncbi:MAG: glycosyltransferase family 2 protein [Phenylobacterium sp.]|uniref:glycosyltransferase family 2 protein n=1 Tax=Phenylobacterium sp. TaxID=1871053 RepID=UPI002732C3F4|nr:glycosyltransferase family 2 protein [Phenylobacterium sp.]MDP3747243.1 glycosyltransferase family 2 protein [Phenylobacterium sp.]